MRTHPYAVQLNCFLFWSEFGRSLFQRAALKAREPAAGPAAQPAYRLVARSERRLQSNDKQIQRPKHRKAPLESNQYTEDAEDDVIKKPKCVSPPNDEYNDLGNSKCSCNMDICCSTNWECSHRCHNNNTCIIINGNEESNQD